MVIYIQVSGRMSKKSFKKYLPLLKLITKKGLQKGSFVSLISSLDDRSVKFICECIHNSISLRYISKLDNNKKKIFLRRIFPYKNLIKKLCKKRKRFAPCRRLIAQKGFGFIVPILSSIIPLVLSLLRN